MCTGGYISASGQHRTIPERLEPHTAIYAVCGFTLTSLVAAKNSKSLMYPPPSACYPALGPTVRPWSDDEYEANLNMPYCQ